MPGELMSETRLGDRLSAISVQALADVGYEVDVSKADPYSLPGQGQGNVAGEAAAEDLNQPESEFIDSVLRGPVVFVDENGKVVRVIRR